VYVYNVTLPRSGHHMLVNCLAGYFSGGTIYNYNGIDSPKTISAGLWQYCESYRHCRCYPCADKRTTWQKYHDTDGDFPIRDGYFYVVQYRHFIPIVLSLCEMWQVKDVIGSLHSWAAIWERFVDKWVLCSYNNVIAIEYDDFLVRPEEYLRKIIHLYNARIDEELLRRVIIQQNISPKRIISKFRNYEDLYEEFIIAEQRFKDKLLRAKCPLLYNWYYYIEDQLPQLFATMKSNPPSIFRNKYVSRSRAKSLQ